MDRRSIRASVIEAILDSPFGKSAEGILTPIDEIVRAVEKFRRNKLSRGEEIFDDDEITLVNDCYICVNGEEVIEVEFEYQKPKFDHDAYRAEGRILARQERDGVYDV
jgi:hypothetical protein